MKWLVDLREPMKRSPIRESWRGSGQASRCGGSIGELLRSGGGAHRGLFLVRRPTIPLEGRTAVIYGAGGAVGGAVARAFAREASEQGFAPLVPRMAAGFREHGWKDVTTEVVPDSVHDVLDEQPEAVARVIERHAWAWATQSQ